MATTLIDNFSHFAFGKTVGSGLVAIYERGEELSLLKMRHRDDWFIEAHNRRVIDTSAILDWKKSFYVDKVLGLYSDEYSVESMEFLNDEIIALRLGGECVAFIDWAKERLIGCTEYSMKMDIIAYLDQTPAFIYSKSSDYVHTVRRCTFS